MPEPAPDPVAACLDDAKKRYEAFGESDAMPRLLAALDVVLAKAAEWDQIAAKLDEYADRADQNGGGERAQHLDGRAYGHRDSAKSLREAISAALLGEVPTDG